MAHWLVFVLCWLISQPIGDDRFVIRVVHRESLGSLSGKLILVLQDGTLRDVDWHSVDDEGLRGSLCGPSPFVEADKTETHVLIPNDSVANVVDLCRMLERARKLADPKIEATIYVVFP
jgi:hypothetical protein